MRNKSDVLSGCMLITLGIAVVTGSIRLRVGSPLEPLSGFFPLLGGLLLIVLSFLLVIRGWMGGGRPNQPLGELRMVAILGACLAVYVAVLESLGYVISTLLITAVILRIMGATSWRVLGLGSVVLSVGAYALFHWLLGVELPAGLLPFFD